MKSVLQHICDDKKEYVQQCRQQVSEAQLLREAATMPKTRGFMTRLRKKTALHQAALIAEIKRASPSQGIIRADFNAGTLAAAYEEGGAACLSVLTDIPYFQGSNVYLCAAREASRLPILRKDFMIDSYQVAEARAIGADCILLIMAALEDAQARELEDAARELGMDVLVEVHDQEELERALACLRSRLIGINNRNLKTLKVDLRTTQRLAPQIPEGYVIVCESGIKSHTDIERVQAKGVHAFLVGESLMREADVTAAVKILLGTV